VLPTPRSGSVAGRSVRPMFTARRFIAIAVAVVVAASLAIAIASAANGQPKHVVYRHSCPQNNPAYEAR
jgi:hypothetical protein